MTLLMLCVLSSCCMSRHLECPNFSADPVPVMAIYREIPHDPPTAACLAEEAVHLCHIPLLYSEPQRQERSLEFK